MTTETRNPTTVQPEWVTRLKAAYDAGYYQTEAAKDQQERFPWQDKTCKDCPFWVNRTCQVLASYRVSTADTCKYFDQQELGAEIVRKRQEQGFARWWDWFNDRPSE